MSQAAALKSQYRYNQTQVVYLSRITETEYHNFLIDTANAWVNHYWQPVIDTEALLKTTLFWKWWTRWWNDIDDRAILQTLYSTPVEQRYTKYREMHQYVFDNGNQFQQYMLKDFTAMKQDFQQEIKKLNPL